MFYSTDLPITEKIEVATVADDTVALSKHGNPDIAYKNLQQELRKTEN